MEVIEKGKKTGKVHSVPADLRLCCLCSIRRVYKSLRDDSVAQRVHNVSFDSDTNRPGFHCSSLWGGFPLSEQSLGSVPSTCRPPYPWQDGSNSRRSFDDESGTRKVLLRSLVKNWAPSIWKSCSKNLLENIKKLSDSIFAQDSHNDVAPPGVQQSRNAADLLRCWWWRKLNGFSF